MLDQPVGLGLVDGLGARPPRRRRRTRTPARRTRSRATPTERRRASAAAARRARRRAGPRQRRAAGSGRRRSRRAGRSRAARPSGCGSDRSSPTAARRSLLSMISAVTARRSTPGARLQASSLSRLGSMGSTVPGHVGARPAPERLRVQPAARSHVGRDVGDVDPEPDAVCVLGRPRRRRRSRARSPGSTVKVGEVRSGRARGRSPCVPRGRRVPCLVLERSREAPAALAIPEQGGDHVARRAPPSREREAPWRRLRRSRPARGRPAARPPSRGQRRLRAALEERLGDGEAPPPLHGRHPPPNDGARREAHLFSTAAFSASTASAFWSPSSGVRLRVVHRLDVRRDPLARERGAVGGRGTRRPSGRARRRPRDRRTSWKVPLPNERVPTMVARSWSAERGR